jgi:hypothetical protein
MILGDKPLIYDVVLSHTRMEASIQFPRTGV